MDSLTQFALGAAIGTAVLGRRIGPRRAAIAGGVLGTLPDLDVLLPFDGPIDGFVEHRGWTHSLFVHSLLAVPIGEGLRRLWRARGRVPDLPRLEVWAAVWLVLTTHALLDWTTTYGTRILWPLSDVPYALSWIFIIDPLYTLPLLIAVLGALILGARWRGVRRGAVVGLVLSTAYLGWTGVAQGIAEAKVRAALAAGGVTPERITMIPMPFNSLLWRGIAIDGARYINVYRSVLDDRVEAPLHIHPRHLAHDRALDAYPPPQRVERFSDGNYAYRRDGEDILIADIRMGVTPNYVFTFRVGRVVAGEDAGSAVIEPAPVERREGGHDPAGIGWLWTRIFDEDAVRAE
ncbi:metal-dependent hydrolase [Marivibrio halodurans]|uniref:Metal-dependent hydrolase n=1 Tax=Marivibrio halodurans TaxID=2039722 RepID=A0A8J7SLS1_9PROT|nr:metal-dependent hydrolase [Marivibrio halodurans]MBP5856431.1 metal-dependent hydrolase [Marivibrio halodurans]